MPFYMPPIQNLQIPAQGNFNPSTPRFNTGGRYNDRGDGWSGQSAGGHGCGRGRHHRGCLPFAEQIAQGGGNPGVTGALYNPNAQRMTHSNPNKLFGNWNACYLCGFDIDDRYTLKTCPRDWCKPTHIEAFIQGNAQSYIAAGYDCCTRGMHKTVLPNAAFWQGGAENTYCVANKFNDLVSVYDSSSNPTKFVDGAPTCDGDKVTVAASNQSPRDQPHLTGMRPSYAAAARSLFGHPLQESLNAVTIVSTKATADTGATSIFIMEGANVVNKLCASKPLSINMPARRPRWLDFEHKIN